MQIVIDTKRCPFRILENECELFISTSCSEDNVYNLCPLTIYGTVLSEGHGKNGKWIEDAESYYRALGDKVDENTPYFTDDIACSVCLEKFNVIDNDTERWAFCPNCGARMVKDDE